MEFHERESRWSDEITSKIRGQKIAVQSMTDYIVNFIDDADKKMAEYEELEKEIDWIVDKMELKINGRTLTDKVKGMNKSKSGDR